ncbi:Dihydrolipoyl dehydrogenase [Candidatus Annandia adelgestsuga]|uniref:Dihydrolipoyl dehydrogenase n=1 Tax=Candidatus Annandia adelgestsuga TaxID=1302411 RepID=A0A3S9J7F3_9ENTR|nr:dihydrolipoyl dehydrogenase [Candidatus Annandia adelgestsuga]AZP36177.1 Dihydrolipoyl dehydrogenase [Candidatus Annandia adelgestsuga]
MNEILLKTEIVVIGSGPSGYSAAFRCADLNYKTFLIEKYKNLGGVCLNVGCIPSKTLLHIVKLILDIKYYAKYKIINNSCNINIKELILFKEKIIKKISNNILNMAKKRNIKIIYGIAEFINNNSLKIKKKNENIIINFNHAIIATGSKPIKYNNLNYDDFIWNSTNSLNIPNIPKKMLIVGGGVIGLEMGTIYYSLGSEIDIIERSSQILPSLDSDVIKHFLKINKSKFNFMLNTKIISIEKCKKGVNVVIKDKKKKKKKIFYNSVLISIGRKPNIKNLKIDNTDIKLNKNGYIKVNNQMKTNVPNIYAIGDVVGQPMLAHKGIHEGHIVAEIISGKKYYFDPLVIPSVSYTNPEIAWVGITEKEAKIKGIDCKVSIFPWKASGRAILSNCDDGITKLIFDKKSKKIIGGIIVGEHADELLSEITLAIEMGCDSEDISLIIHPHPTLSESIGLSSDIFNGTITDLLNFKKKY